MPFGKKFNKEEVQEEVYDEIFGERIERQGIEEMIESVQCLSKQLELILEEVNKRDSKIEELELAIEKLIGDLELSNESNNLKKEAIDKLNEQLIEKQNTIDKKVNKIKSLEEEVNGLRLINKELNGKLKGISEILK